MFPVFWGNIWEGVALLRIRRSRFKRIREEAKGAGFSFENWDDHTSSPPEEKFSQLR